MKRTFVTNLALLLFVNFLIKPFWIFGIDRTVQNVVGAEDYGFYLSLLNFSVVLNIILDLGITNFNNRHIAQNEHLLSKYFSNIVIIRIFLAFLYLVVCLITAFFIKYSKEQVQMLVFLIFNQFLLSFVLYLRSNLAGLHLFRIDSMISVLDRTILIVICSIMLWGHITPSPFKIQWFVYAQTGAYLITAIIAFLFVLSKTTFLKLKFNRVFFLAILRQSYPFALLTLLMACYNRVDTIMLERILPNGEEQTGIYAHSFRILEAISMFPYLFSVLLLPMFSRMLKQNQPVIELVKLSFLLLFVPVSAISISSFFFKSEIISFLYVEHISLSSKVFGILILGLIPVSATYIFGTLLTANGSMKALNYMAATGMIINIGLNAVLIPKYQAWGAAIASLTTQSLTAMIQFLIAKRVFSFQPNWRLLGKLLFYCISTVLTPFYILKLNLNWIIEFGVAIGLVVVLAFAIKLINLGGLFRILRSDSE